MQALFCHSNYLSSRPMLLAVTFNTRGNRTDQQVSLWVDWNFPHSRANHPSHGGSYLWCQGCTTEQEQSPPRNQTGPSNDDGDHSFSVVPCKIRTETKISRPPAWNQISCCRVKTPPRLFLFSTKSPSSVGPQGDRLGVLKPFNCSAPHGHADWAKFSQFSSMITWMCVAEARTLGLWSWMGL